MITGEEVLSLQQTIQPRQPRGSPANIEWERQNKAFEKILRQFQKEHGFSWFDWMKEADHAVR